MQGQVKILKIGGSIITEKTKGVMGILKENSLVEICRAISDLYIPGSLILVHGAGSFGHPFVEKYGIDNPAGIANTHLSCLRLSSIVCEKLIESGISPIPIHPLIFFRKAEKLECDLDFIKSALSSELLPVFHGDVIFNSVRNKFEVLSGDEIVAHLSQKLPVSAAGFATDVEGVIVDGEVVKRFDRNMLEKMEKMKRTVTKNSRSDVTGEMLGKLRNIFRIKSSCRVFIFKGKYENVAKFLSGEEVGTEITR